MTNSINWDKFEANLFNSVERNEYLLARSKAIFWQEGRILKHRSPAAHNAFKTFLKEVDKAILRDSQRLTMIREFKVIDHLETNSILEQKDYSHNYNG
jgi:hypothetical protein